MCVCPWHSLNGGWVLGLCLQTIFCVITAIFANLETSKIWTIQAKEPPDSLRRGFFFPLAANVAIFVSAHTKQTYDALLPMVHCHWFVFPSPSMVMVNIIHAWLRNLTKDFTERNIPFLKKLSIINGNSCFHDASKWVQYFLLLVVLTIFCVTCMQRNICVDL